MSEKSVAHLKEALNIDREPFSDEGVSGLFFPGCGRQEILEQLLHLARYGAPLLFLLGENGVGKSAILAQLESRLDPSIYRWFHLDAEVLADDRFLLQALENGFDVDLGDTKETAIQALSRLSRELESYSQTPLFIIEDAQNLSIEAVGFIQSLLSYLGRAGFRCLMVADGKSVGSMPLLAPFAGSGVDYQELVVPPLNAAGCSEYLAYRMTTSGLGDIQFSANQHADIFNQSLGNIDKINIVARQLLVDSFPYSKNKPKASKIPVMHCVLAVVLLGLLVSFYWVDPFAGEEPVKLVEVEVGSVDSAEPGPVDSPYRDLDATLEPLLVESEAGLQEVVELDVQSLEQAAESDAKTARQDLDRSVVDGEVDFNFTESASQDVLQPVVDREQPLDEDLAISQQAPEEAKKPVVAQKQPTKPKPSLTAREQWLMSLDRGKYTLQMLGAREEASVQKFLAKYPSLKQVAYYRTKHKSKDWYVVVYGVYDSKDKAKQIIGKLPSPLRDSRPWARSVAGVQDEIAQNTR